MSDDAIMVVILLAIAVTTGAVAWFVLRLVRRASPLHQLLTENTPMPRAPHPVTPLGLDLVAYSAWQSGTLGPRDLPGHINPDPGPHLMAGDGERAILRGGAVSYMRRSIGMIPLLAMVISAMVVNLRELIFFLNTESMRMTSREVVVNGEAQLEFGYYEPSVMNYLRNLWRQTDQCLSNLSTPDYFMSYCIMGEAMFAWVGLAALIALIALMLTRPGAPLVFDRARQIVYSTRRGRIHAAAWDGIEMVMSASGRNTAPAFALSDIEGNGGTRWFPLAAWSSTGEDFGTRSHLGPLDRWQASRLWLVMYMARLLDPPAQIEPGRGMIRFLVPREGRLPDDIEPRLQAALSRHPLQPGPLTGIRPAPTLGQRLRQARNSRQLG
ncbi:MAG: hypothetical protein Q4G25_00510 [Paracoccus sp. (in: a-proteobacteria)]|nr:hypothetical protein [Paracoccus sp. (in: a-proteobacteria)]